MPLEIKMQQTIGEQNALSVTVYLAGSLDSATTPELERELAPVVAEPIRKLVFDLADLKFISSAGLRAFAVVGKHLGPSGAQVSFIHLQPQIQVVFEIIKNLPSVSVFKDLAEMDRFLALQQSRQIGEIQSHTIRTPE
ncbi:MAG: STAS domain-containing protein [Verrucomicrobiota bacterium]